MFTSGKVADTIDYAVVIERIRAVLVEQHYGLVENLAEHVAQIILKEFHAPWVRVSIAKIGAQQNARRVGVVIEERVSTEQLSSSGEESAFRTQSSGPRA